MLSLHSICLMTIIFNIPKNIHYAFWCSIERICNNHIFHRPYFDKYPEIFLTFMKMRWNEIWNKNGVPKRELFPREEYRSYRAWDTTSEEKSVELPCQTGVIEIQWASAYVRRAAGVSTCTRKVHQFIVFTFRIIHITYL